MLQSALRPTTSVLRNVQQKSASSKNTPNAALRLPQAKKFWDNEKINRLFEHGTLHSQDSARKSRTELLWRIRLLIKKQFGSSYRLETFGSVKYGLATPKSDMDLIILDLARPSGFDPHNTTGLPRVYNIRALAKALRLGGFTDVRAIPASVPIVKFTDRKTGIQCDININDQPGYWNTLMIQEYTKLSPYLSPLLMTIKLWAKPRGLNSPGGSKPRQPITFSSYALALMTISFLQEQRLLPNLQDDIHQNTMAHSFWNRNPIYLCDLRFNRSAQPIPHSGRITLITLLAEWFEFWSNFNPDKHTIDIRHGGVLPRLSESPGLELALHLAVQELEVSQTPDQGPFKPTSCVHKSGLYNAGAFERWEHQTLCVIDPFIRVRNVTQNISSLVFRSFQEECRRARAELRTRQSDQGVAM